MAFVVKPSRNATLDMAWSAHKAAQRAEAKASKAVAKPEVAAPLSKAWPVKKAAAKSKNAKPPAKRAAKKGKK
jgi:hypothetical protein